MYVVGLTGGLATGKSTVAGLLKKKSARVLDADRIAHNCLKTAPCKNQVIAAFGSDVLRGSILCRRKIAEVVFTDERKLKKLERIIHPCVEKEIRKKIRLLANKKGVLVVEVPLLFESKMNKLMDCTIVVKAKKALQIKRAKKSLKITEKEIKNRINKQMPLSKKIRMADFIIDNSGTLNQTKKQVDKLWLKLQ